MDDMSRIWIEKLELGGRLIGEHSYAAAEALMKALLQEQPAIVEARYVLGMALMQQGRYDEALLEASRLRELEPAHSGAAMIEIYVYQKQDLVVTEVSLLKKLIARLQAGTDRRFLGEAWSLLGSAYTLLGEPEEAVRAFLASSRVEQVPEQQIREYSNALFAANYSAKFQGKRMQQMAVKYNDFFRKVKVYEHFAVDRKRLRLGIISPDLRYHPVAAFLYPLLRYISRDRYEVYGYAANAEDAVSGLLRGQCDGWCNIAGWAAEAAAQRIAADQIDILLDLSGHTRNNCLPVLAYRPAPVQLCGIGYFSTTGLRTVDYFLSDIYCDPPGAGEVGFSESILRLPHSHFCYMPLQKMPDIVESPCQRKGYITFGCFNNFNKVTDEVLEVWAAVLRALPSSRLLLKSRLFGSSEGVAAAQQRLLRQGFSLDRVELRGFSDGYLHEYADMDIALDTFPYTGGITTCEALYMGVPVVTLCGQRHGARFGYSLLMNAGLGELVAADLEAYAARAIALAADPELLAGLRQNLRPMLEGSVLMNGSAYAAEVESVLESVWQKCLHQQAEERLSVRDLQRLRKAIWQRVEVRDYRGTLALARRGLHSAPKNQEFLETTAAACLELGDAEAAAPVIGELRQLYPQDGYAGFLAARLAFLRGAWDESATTAAEVLSAGDDMAADVRLRLYNLLGQSYKEMGDAGRSLEHYLQAARLAPDRAAQAVEYANYLFNMHYVTGFSQRELFAAHRKYTEYFADVRPYRHQHHERHAKLRIGYLSPDFRLHVVVFFSYAFFRDYDRDGFEVFCYQRGPEDAISMQIANMVDGWRNVAHLSDAETAELIYRDEIDILFDLAGHTRNSGLPVLAYKPAPIQISGIGYFDTTGLEAVDYFLTDRYTDPAGMNDAFFTEKLIRLPHSHFCYTAADTMPDCQPLSSEKGGCITFGSFNNFAKVTDDMLRLWQQILAAVPKSRLLLKSSAFGNAAACSLAEERLARAGFLTGQVELRPASADYLSEYSAMDIALDTYPYPGGGTTCDALYMGIPVITLTGQRHGARFGYSLLQNIGLPECCADSPEAYVQAAVRLAVHPRRLKILHEGMRQRMRQSPLMNGRMYMAGVEQAYRVAWERYMAGREPAALDI